MRVLWRWVIIALVLLVALFLLLISGAGVVLGFWIWKWLPLPYFYLSEKIYQFTGLRPTLSFAIAVLLLGAFLRTWKQSLRALVFPWAAKNRTAVLVITAVVIGGALGFDWLTRPPKSALFDAWGNPLFNYYQHPGGGIELLPRYMTRHPELGTPVWPVNPDIAARWKAQQQRDKDLQAQLDEARKQLDEMRKLQAERLGKEPPGHDSPRTSTPPPKDSDVLAPKHLSATVRKVTVNGLGFELDGCIRSEQDITCLLTIENQTPGDLQFALIGSDGLYPKSGSRIVDEFGNVHYSVDGIIGKMKQVSPMEIIVGDGLELAPRIKMKAILKFQGVDPRVRILQEMRISFAKGYALDHADLKNIEISQGETTVSRSWVGGQFPDSRLHGQVTADVRGGAARRWDSFRVRDPAMRDVGGWQPAQIEWLAGPIDGIRVHPPRLSKVWQYRADRSTLHYQDSSGAVWDRRAV